MNKKHSIPTGRFLAVSMLLLVIGSACTDWDIAQDPDEIPEAVELSISEVTDSSVTLVWTQNPDSIFKNYTVYYSTSDIVDTTDKAVDTISFARDTVKVVKGLDADRRYYFRVMVNSILGTMSASNIVDTITYKKITDRRLVLDTVSVTENTVKLSWVKDWVDGYEKNFVIYMDTATTVDSLDTPVDTIHDFMNTVIEGLARTTRYSFRVFQLRNGIPSAGSNTITLTTRSGHPQPVILGAIGGIDKNDTAVTLRWSKSSDTLDFYRYAVITDTVAAADTFTQFDSTDERIILRKKLTDTTAVIAPLALNRKYWFCVYTIDTTGLFSKSNVETTTTDDGIPNPVTVTARGLGDTVTITWTESDFPGFKEYRIYRGDTREEADSTGVLVAKITDKDSLSVRRFLATPKKEWYRVYVVSTTGVMGGSYPVMGFPVVLTVQPIDSPFGGVHLTWTTTDYPDSLFSSYKVYRSQTSATLESPGVAITPLILKSEDVDYIDLTADSGEVYYYRIQHNARNESGFTVGQFSNEVMVTTSPASRAVFRGAE